MLRMAVRPVETLAQRLRRLREREGLSQGALSRRSGVSGATISRIEAGTVTNPLSENLGELARALHISPSYLLYGGEPLPPGVYPPEDEAYFASMERLSEPGRSEVRAQALRLARERLERERVEMERDRFERRVRELERDREPEDPPKVVG